MFFHTLKCESWLFFNIAATFHPLVYVKCVNMTIILLSQKT